MAKRLLLTAALGALVTALLAQSPPPPPGPTESAQEKQQRSGGKTNSGNTSQQSITRPERNDKYTKAQSSESRDKSSTDWWIVVFTGTLTLVGILQYWAMRKQAGYMRDALMETKRSADASNESERAAVLIESIVGEPQSGGAQPYFSDRSVVVFTLKNFCATVAYNVKITGGVKFSTGSMDIKGAQGVTMAPQGSNKWITVSLSTKIPPDEINKINMGNQTLTYKINVTYDDAFSKTHEYKAAGQYIPLLRGFITGYSKSY
jgi:hypothetical protein